MLFTLENPLPSCQGVRRASGGGVKNLVDGTSTWMKSVMLIAGIPLTNIYQKEKQCGG